MDDKSANDRYYEVLNTIVAKSAAEPHKTKERNPAAPPPRPNNEQPNNSDFFLLLLSAMAFLLIHSSELFSRPGHFFARVLGYTVVCGIIAAAFDYSSLKGWLKMLGIVLLVALAVDLAAMVYIARK